MNLKLLFVLCLVAALLIDVEAARDKKKKKQRNEDENEEDQGPSGMTICSHLNGYPYQRFYGFRKTFPTVIQL